MQYISASIQIVQTSPLFFFLPFPVRSALKDSLSHLELIIIPLQLMLNSRI